MLMSRLSRLGSSIVNELSRSIYLTISTTRYIQRPYSQYECSLFKVPPEMKTSLTIFQQSYDFCTLASNNASEEENGQKETISVAFVDKDGEEKHIKVPIGMSMLEAAHENDIELEGNTNINAHTSNLSGACEGSLACSTCHMVVMYYNKLEDPTDEENDMLDLAFGLTEMS